MRGVLKVNILQQRIIDDGEVFPNNVLKVDSFLNHQIDPHIMYSIANDFYQHFKSAGITKILTIEASGIAPAIFVAQKFDVPMLFAKKKEPSTLQNQEVYTELVHSYTKNTDSNIVVSKQFLDADDKVLVVDDFLANGEAAMGLISIAEQAGADVAGVAICIEKSFQNGRQRILDHGYEVYSAARIASLENNQVRFNDGH